MVPFDNILTITKKKKFKKEGRKKGRGKPHTPYQDMNSIGKKESPISNKQNDPFLNNLGG